MFDILRKNILKCLKHSYWHFITTKNRYFSSIIKNNRNKKSDCKKNNQFILFQAIMVIFGCVQFYLFKLYLLKV